MKADLTAALLGAADLVARVGEQITWGEREQGAAGDAIVLHELPSQHRYMMKARQKFRGSPVQINCLGDTPMSADQTRAVLIGILDTLHAAPFRGVFIERQYELPPATVEGPMASGSTTVFCASLDVRVWHQA